MTRKWICILAITLIAMAPAVAASPLDDAIEGAAQWIESVVDAVTGFFAEEDAPVTRDGGPDPDGGPDDELGSVWDPNG